MRGATEAQSIPVVEIGAAARSALREGARGRVLAVFRRSFYVQMTGAGVGPGVACLGPLTLGAGPLNALCDLPGGTPWPEPGTAGAAAWVEGGALRIGAWCFRLETARPWSPPPLGTVARSLRAEGIALLRRVCAESVPARGLAGLRLPVREGAAVTDSPLEAALQRAASAALEALANWVTPALPASVGETPAPARDQWPLPEALPGLLGLGGGLTPAGDDLLGGALIALSALGLTAPAERLGAALLPLAPGRTGVISAAHLAAAAAGLGAAPLHAALDALSRLHRPDLERAVRGLDAIGHTSGWDALAGAVAVWGVAPKAGLTARHPVAGDRLRSGAQPWSAPAREHRPC